MTTNYTTLPTGSVPDGANRVVVIGDKRYIQYPDGKFYEPPPSSTWSNELMEENDVARKNWDLAHPGISIEEASKQPDFSWHYEKQEGPYAGLGSLAKWGLQVLAMNSAGNMLFGPAEAATAFAGDPYAPPGGGWENIPEFAGDPYAPPGDPSSWEFNVPQDEYPFPDVPADEYPLDSLKNEITDPFVPQDEYPFDSANNEIAPPFDGDPYAPPGDPSSWEVPAGIPWGTIANVLATVLPAVVKGTNEIPTDVTTYKPPAYSPSGVGSTGGGSGGGSTGGGTQAQMIAQLLQTPQFMKIDAPKIGGAMYEEGTQLPGSTLSNSDIFNQAGSTWNQALAAQLRKA